MVVCDCIGIANLLSFVSKPAFGWLLSNLVFYGIADLRFYLPQMLFLFLFFKRLYPMKMNVDNCCPPLQIYSIEKSVQWSEIMHKS